MSKKYYHNYEDLNRPVKLSDLTEKVQDKGVLEYLFSDRTIQLNANRRDFLKMFGFSIASAAIAASCEQPVRKAIPYVIQPEKITPGKASYYASSYYDGNDYASILVKVRDGRPIKIEGNELSPVNKGKIGARVQASVLNLYDDARHKNPMNKGDKVSWDTLDKKIIKQLKKIDARKGKMAIISSSIASPSTQKIIEDFLSRYSSTIHIQYDPVSVSGLLKANELSFGKRIIPSYHFEEARVIVGSCADFLGTWLMPVEYAKQYALTRNVRKENPQMSYHVQMEPGMSLTGTNADKRIRIKASEEKQILSDLYHLIKKDGQEEEGAKKLVTLADKLLENKGKALVVSGSNDYQTQLIVNAINTELNSYGNTIDLSKPCYVKKGDDEEIAEFVSNLEQGEIEGVIFYDANPVYDYPEGDKIKTGLEKVKLSISLASHPNETAACVNYVCPDHYYLEAWNDVEIKKGEFSLAQPAIRPIFNTRAAQESLLIWSGKDIDYLEYIKEYWRKSIFPEQSKHTSFEKFWNHTLHDGVLSLPVKGTSAVYSNRGLMEALTSVSKEQNEPELHLYEKVSIGAGNFSNNPWLQELPDPVSKICWDNYACVSPKLAQEKELETGNLVKINNSIVLPVFIQPGQVDYSVSVALGYGRENSGIVADSVGVNIYPWIHLVKNQRLNFQPITNLEKIPGEYELAQTQTHHSMEGRAIVREASLDEYIKNPAAGNEMHTEIEKHHATLYKEYDFPGHHWGMAIDLNSCIGCSACVIACQAENNIPTVGKREVLRAHEMHWIRIDRYYSGDANNPETVRQPVMCQHCDNAPCENVCPVAATNHSNEGLNQMAYNRCIGTRYCNNNCPYKVRRFNWYDYTQADAIPSNTVDPTGLTIDLRRMVLNPDVTVRAKGVIEKCSFCIQRIQEKKLKAKLENRKLEDNEIKTACMQTCPTDAIIFGDLNDPESKVSKMFKNKRNYHLLEEIHTLPSVGYLTKIRNVNT